MAKKKKKESVLYARLPDDVDKFVASEIARTQHFQSTIAIEALRAAKEKRAYTLEPKVFKTVQLVETAAEKRRKRTKARA